MNELATVIFTVTGGLGAFLLGMRHLSDGLQAASGEGLRRFMSLATGRPLVGVATGVVSTMIVQSSSIITVMLVGFVSSRLMTLAQSLNVLVGANIGTTFTVWIMAFAPSPEMLGLVFLCLGSAIYFPFPRSRIRHAGLAMIGLGLVFLGMFFMKEGVAPIRESPALSEAIGRLSATDFKSVIFVALVSAAFTAIVQSSAASILIFMTFASQGLVTYETAIAALFGANIGTTATGWLASIGGGSGAKRTALAHTLTNFVGSVLFIPLVLPVFVPLGKAIFPDWQANVMAPVAVSDTIFSIMRGLVFFPLSGVLAKFLERIIPEPAEEKPHLSLLNAYAKRSPEIACAQAAREVAFMSESVTDLLHSLRDTLSGEGNREKLEQHIFRREEILDNVQREVTEFLGEVMLSRLSTSTAAEARRLLREADELESASDEIASAAKALKRIHAEDEELSGSDLALVLDIHDASSALFADTSGDAATLRQAAKELKAKLRQARQLQLMRIGGGSAAAPVLAALDLLNAYDRFRKTCIAIAEVS
ncbi:MAG: Na/Pi cotransporter family protein [Kiritimatiellae bacterium]|nr:Na/Pi cotransporter family protein [Kiritimatiellia bacterium]